MRSLISWPLLATAITLVGFGLWLSSLPSTCGYWDPPWPLPWGLIPAVAIVEAWAAKRRGGDALSMVVWAVGAGAVVFAGIFAGLLIYAGKAGCFD